MEILYFPELSFNKRQKFLQDNRDNFWQFFIAGLMNFIAAENNFPYFKDPAKNTIEDKKELVQKAFDLFEDQELRDNYFRSNNYKSLKTLFYTYYQEEIKATEDDLVKKVKDYHQFLIEIKPKIELCIFLGLRYPYQNRTISFEDYAKPKLGMDFIDTQELTYALARMFSRLDSLYFKELFHDKKFPEQEVKHELQKEFHFENYASPIIFIEYPSELAVYKLLLKNWLRMEIEKRKREFTTFLSELPKIYNIIINYADRLLDPREVNFLSVNTPEYYQYPQHIFKGFKGFKLFEYYAETLVSEAQFTFLYRYMRDEKQKNFKIIADIKTFHEWFNNQEYTDKLYNINGTLSKVFTNERLQNYNLIKKMINQLYAVAP